MIGQCLEHYFWESCDLHLVMEVLEGQAAWLSDFEVLQHLRERREKREEAGRSIPAAENVQTIEFEASVD